MYQNVVLYDEPRKILKHIDDVYCEMEQDEHDFICGLIKMKKPQKVLEIGVAGGATTAVIMSCLNIINPKASMYSVDISKECYRKKGKLSGYQLEIVKDYLPNYSQHQFLLGGGIPKYIDNIGKNIDFCILDTTHAMPGEVLDFLCVLPYLSDGAIVILHDVASHLLANSNNVYSMVSFATKILLDAVSATKYYNLDTQTYNIAGFMVNQQTRDNIANVFSALSITWYYEPNYNEMMLYRNFFLQYYNEECIKLFDLFWKMNHQKIEERTHNNVK